MSHSFPPIIGGRARAEWEVERPSRFRLDEDTDMVQGYRAAPAGVRAPGDIWEDDDDAAAGTDPAASPAGAEHGSPPRRAAAAPGPRRAGRSRPTGTRTGGDRGTGGEEAGGPVVVGSGSPESAGSRAGNHTEDGLAAPEVAAADEHEAAQAAPQRSVRAGMLMASGTIASRVLGLVRTFLLASALGVGGAISDIWDLANVLPNQIYAMIAGGVFSAILVPLIIKAAKAKDGGRDYLSRLVTLLTTFLLLVTVASTLAAPWIIKVLGRDYSPDQLHVATQLSYFLLPQIFFYGMYAIFGQILNAKESYGPFMWSPVLNNVVALATLTLFMLMFGAESSGSHHTLENWTFEKSLVIGLGSTLGIVLQALILIIPLRKLRLGLRPDFRFRGVGLREAGRLAGWAAMTMVIGNVPFFVYNWVEASIAAYRESLRGTPDYTNIPGAAVLTNASMLSILPHAVIAVSLATILVNRLSHASADGDIPRLARTLNSGLRTVGLPMIFASTALIVVAGPLGFVFAGGSKPFGVFLGITLIILMLTAPVFSATVFLGRTFYSMNDAKTPFWVTVAIAGLSIAAAFGSLLVDPHIRIYVIALITTVTNVIGAVINHVCLTRKIGSYRLRSIFDSWARFTAAALLSAVVGVGLLWLLGGYSLDGFAWSGRFQALFVAALVSAVMGVVYLVILRWWKTKELNDVLDPVLARFRR
ncbi:murein biosynthesis integral membrane protein MurJ [Falsarthrobacter nasiphocae]|uniref:Peptidoglycan lipid II flippase n=1 Tax=Falsarthrobacter nasiphocae TaxID=189863 RepID=A0AAE4C584_9MICC|nr:lipid II flippase MurJ [Falsarthrobacter nasiphocae]MDR6892086.1 putative peptidoglycan lipid II flippase [Falsarthrobacter nasiphocae]